MRWILLFSLFLSSCAYKEPLKFSNAVYVTIKTANMRFSDAGFIRHEDGFINLQLFNSAMPILDIEIKDKICINKICYKKSNFNAKFLRRNYEEDFLSNILLNKAIFKGKNLEKNKHGFTQRFLSKQEDIFYEVKKDSISFKDKVGKIVIKIKKI